MGNKNAISNKIFKVSPAQTLVVKTKKLYYEN